MVANCKSRTPQAPHIHIKSKAVPLQTIEALGERRYSSYSFMTLALVGGEWSASTPRPCFTPGTHCTGGWLGPRAGLDREARGKILCPCRGSNLGHPVRSQTLYWLSYHGSHIHIIDYNFERVSRFVYLGSLVNETNDIKEEISKRIQNSNRCYYGLLTHFKSCLLTHETKCRLHTTLVRPVSTC
jgi:hypothetical protein